MQLQINGTLKDFPAPLTVDQLLTRLEMEAEQVVVELNREILTKDAHDRSLQDGDTLELIQFVGGG